MKCSEPNCTHDAAAFGTLPGHSTRFVCAEHQADATGFISADGSLAAHYKPIAEYVSPDAAPELITLCTNKRHNAKHQRAAVLAYAWPGPHETEQTTRDPETFGPGVACPGCVIELVATAKLIGFPLELAELP